MVGWRRTRLSDLCQIPQIGQSAYHAINSGVGVDDVHAMDKTSQIYELQVSIPREVLPREVSALQVPSARRP